MSEIKTPYDNYFKIGGVLLLFLFFWVSFFIEVVSRINIRKVPFF